MAERAFQQADLWSEVAPRAHLAALQQFSQRLAQVETGALAEAALASLAQSTGASRVLYFALRRERPAGTILELQSAWHESATTPPPDSAPPLALRLRDYPGSLARLIQGQAVHGPATTWPAAEGEAFVAAGLAGIVLVPLPALNGAAIGGALALVHASAQHVWGEAEVALLQVAAGILALDEGRRHAAAALSVERQRLATRVQERTLELATANMALTAEVLDRKQAQKLLREREQVLRIVLDNVPQRIFWKDRQSVYLGCNQAFAHDAGLDKPEDICGKTDFDLPWTRAEAEAYRAADLQVMTTDQPTYHVIEPQGRADGSQAWLDTSKVPLHDADGRVVGMLGAYEDITERRRAEAELQEAKNAAETASRTKSEFLANMSHEIRTPMTAILGFAQTLLDFKLSETERLNAVRTIQRNGDHLLTIINDILDLSKLEAGKMAIERVLCSPCQVVAEVASLMRVRATAKGLAFEIEYRGPMPQYVESDPTRLRQILLNLTGNAIKFTDTGSVRLVASMTTQLAPEIPDASNPDRLAPVERFLQFDVVDTGIGMSAEQVARLFEPFTQADTSTTRRFGGTGLGLTISKRLAQALGGDVVVVHTELGRGTCFRTTVTTGCLDGVPLLADPATAMVHVRDSTAASRGPAHEPLAARILLAEDGPDNQRLISLLLRRAGATVTVVENGRLAVEAALAASARREPFDVILMDMQMPELDGYEATGRLRAQHYTRPIIALTAHAMPADRQKCLQAGCDDYVTKPVERHRLLEVIQQQLPRDPTRADGAGG